MDNKTLVALDCGNSSFRVVVGQYRDGKILTEVIDQQPNSMIKIGEYYYWDILRLFNSFKDMLKKVVSKYPHIDSIGVCTWGVDFALFDKDGHMLSNPLSYRNEIGGVLVDELSDEDKKDLFFNTGILCDKINSVYMLAGMKKHFPVIFENADRCLMVPDILNYFLTGEMVNEPSELSTTQLMDVKSKGISKFACDKFDIDKKLFGNIGVHGTKIGDLRDDIAEEVGIDYKVPVICVPSHDTGSAICAMPAKEERFGFVSSGTWSLIGTELDEPVLSDDILNANLTNELGAFDKITLLKNAAGMFIVNHLKAEYDDANGKKSEWDEITRLAKEAKKHCVIDLNDKAFFNPTSMSKSVWKFLSDSGQVEGEMDWGILFRAFYESLSCCYATTFEDIEKITGKQFEKIYIAGGGTSSSILLELTAKHTKKTVVVCYGESTSMGNMAVQLKYFNNGLGLKDIRAIIENTYNTKEVSADETEPEILEKYRNVAVS